MRDTYDLPSEDEPIGLRVKELVSEDRGEPVSKLKWTDSLYQDLGMYGDDVSDFFENYLKEYEVDMSKFEFEDYFPSEGWSLIEFFSGLFGRSKSYIPITIIDLVIFAKRKKWEPDRLLHYSKIKDLGGK